MPGASQLADLLHVNLPIHLNPGLWSVWGIPVSNPEVLPADNTGSASFAALHHKAAGGVGEQIWAALVQHERKQPALGTRLWPLHCPHIHTFLHEYI